MIKAMVLLHVYDGDRFLGQSLVTVEAKDWIALMRGVTDAYPSGEVQSPFANEPERIPMPILRDGYGPGTNVRVMQILPISDDATQRVQKTELDVELASAPRREEDTPLQNPRSILSADDLKLRAASVHVILDSERAPSPQERADAIHTLAMLREFTTRYFTYDSISGDKDRVVKAASDAASLKAISR